MTPFTVLDLKGVTDDGVFEGYCFNGTVRDWQVILPDFGTIQGPFQISSLEFSGRHDGEMTFEIALESAGELSFMSL